VRKLPRVVGDFAGYQEREDGRSRFRSDDRLGRAECTKLPFALEVQGGVRTSADAAFFVTSCVGGKTPRDQDTNRSRPDWVSDT